MISSFLVLPSNRSLLTVHSNRPSVTVTVVNMMIYRRMVEAELEVRGEATLTRVNVGELRLVVRLVIQTPSRLGSS